MKNFFSNIKNNLNVLLLLAVMWVILFEEVTPFVIITALIMPVCVLVLTDNFLLIDEESTYKTDYMIGVLPLIKYFFFLFYEIYAAGIGVIPNILKGESNTAYVSCETKLTDEFLIDILANSVTLTPGTVTVQKSGQHLKILALDTPDVAGGEDPREALPLRLEAILLEFEEKKREKHATEKRG